MNTYTDQEVSAFCEQRAGWSGDRAGITRTYEFPTFHRAVAFIVQAGMIADVADHHPDMTITYSRVRVDLSTHSAGGVTTKDFALADALDAAAGS